MYLAFDSDANGSGQAASRELMDYLSRQRIPAKVVHLPEGQDPNSFFVRGGNAGQFRCLLEQARP